jgi:tetratricopeptide (TPR) repeat protein
MAARRPTVAILVLLTLTLSAYAPVLRGGFLWGDVELLSRNAGMESWAGWKALWTGPAAALRNSALDPVPTPLYAPIASTLRWTEYRFFGTTPWPYHAVSIALHLLAAWLLWSVLRRLGLQWGALLGAALFAIHPMQVETVSWISQQGQILAVVFVLLATSCWLRWMGLRPSRRAEAAEITNVRNPVGTAAAYVLCLALSALALLTHPIAVALPIGLLATGWVRHGGISRRTVLGILPIAVLAAAYAGGCILHADAGDGLLRASTGIVAALRRLAFPAGLSWIYPARDLGAATWACWGALIGAFGIAFALVQNARGLLIGYLFFLLGLLLSIAVLTPAELQFGGVSDRLIYLASIGLFGTLAGGIAYWVRKHPKRATPILATTLAVVALLTLLSSRRAWVFADAERLYRDTLDKNPNAAVAAESLGDLLLARYGKDAHDEAARLFRLAMEAAPARTTAARSYAALLAAQGKSVQAQKVLRNALEVRPNDALANEALADLVVASIGPDAYPRVLKYYVTAVAGAPERASAVSRLATIYVSQSRIPDAIAVLEKAVPANARDVPLRLQLAGLLVKMKDYEKADRQFDIANALDPKNAEARAQWGDMLLESGRPHDAEAQFRRALEADPRDALQHIRLGRALREQGKLGSALNEFEAAQELDEKSPIAFLEAAHTYLKLQDEEKTEQYLQAALRVDPHFTPAHVALGRLYLTSQNPDRRNIFGGISLLRNAVQETRGEDLSVLVAYGIALGSAKEYDQALAVMDKAIALGRRLNLAPEQNELLLQSRQKLEIAAADTPGQTVYANPDGMISRMGTGTEETRDFAWPNPRQRPVMDLLTRPLDLSTPPTAADIWIPPKAGPSPLEAGGAIVLPPTPTIPLPSVAPATHPTGPTP